MKTLKITEQLNKDYFPFFDNDFGTILRSFEGFEFASVINAIDDVSGDYGSIYVNSKHGRRAISITGDLVGADIFNNRRLLLRALRQTGTLKLFEFTTYDGQNLRFEAEISKLLFPYTHQIHTFLIQAVAPDWRFYDQTLRSINLNETILRGGFAIPATIPLSLDLDPSGAISGKIITNSGNEVTDPLITLTGPGTTFYLENVTANKNFTLAATLIALDSVVIDVKNRTVVKNGTVNLYGDISGEFWSLLPGDNELRYTVTSGSTPDTNLNFMFRDAYNGI